MNTRYPFSPGSVAKIARSMMLPPATIPERLLHAPMQLGPVVRMRAGRAAGIELMQWGIPLRWLPRPLIIARSETITTKPSCRRTFASSRCLVIADGFYDWQGGGRGAQPVEFRLPYDEPMVFAGIWAKRPLREGSGEGYAILTTRASAVLSHSHERMPVILRPADWQRWLAPNSNPKELSYLLQPWNGPLITRAVTTTMQREDGNVMEP